MKSIIFTVVAVWLFFNIKYENKDKKWFRLLFGGTEWTPIIKSLEFANDLEVFRNENRQTTTDYV
ncbi:MAG: hypothetical protein ACKO1F_02800 [Flammeovirgaceae bacterium]